MNAQDEVVDLMEKIRHPADEAVLNQNGARHEAASPAAAEDWPLIAAGNFPAPPPAPAFAAFPPVDPVPLAEAATLVPRAAEKLAVHQGIPGVLRPMFRNQGGFNGILLQTCGRLVEVSEHLQQENVDLRARLDAIADHLREQNSWLAGLAQANTESRQWRRIVQGQFARVEQQLAQRFEEYDGRCHRAEIRLDRAEGLLDGVRAVADEQGGSLARLETQVEQQHVWTRQLQALADEEAASLAPGGTADKTRLDQLGSQVNRLQEVSEEHAAHLQTADARLDEIGGQVNYLQGESDEQHRYIQTVHGHLDRLGEHLGRVEEGGLPGEQIEGIAAHTDRLGTHLRNLQADSDQQNERVEALQRRVDEAAGLCTRAREELAKALSHHDLLEANARRLEERQINDSSFLRAQLTFQQRLLGEWLAPPTAAAAGPAALPDRDVPASSGEAQAVAERLAEHEMDSLYLAFENTMRGDRGTIKERVRFYLPYLAEAQVGSAARPILDLGCGRGEWLEVLRDEGLQAAGVDLNTCMIDECWERGLNATAGNALDHLASLADASCGAVTAFHLIEHLPFKVLVKFFHRVRAGPAARGPGHFRDPQSEQRARRRLHVLQRLHPPAAAAAEFNALPGRAHGLRRGGNRRAQSAQSPRHGGGRRN